MRRAVFLLLVMLVTAVPAWAESVERLCAGGGRAENDPQRAAVAAAALDEFRRFGGHVIDFDGRLSRFGSVETEGEEDPQRDAGAVPIVHIAWRHVWRYWNLPRLTGKTDISGSLRVTSFGEEATGLTREDGTVRRESQRLATLLAGIDAQGSMPPPLKDALKTSLIRAAVSDVPWSGAFISAVMAKAGIAAEAFRYSGSHIRYIEQAYGAIGAERGGAAHPGLYRACPLASAVPRVGDLICYCREDQCRGLARKDLYALVAAQAAGAGPEDDVGRTHCDVVVDVNLATQKLGAVGGNVVQAVTYRAMKLRSDGKLSDNVGTRRCADDAPGGAAQLTAARDCSFNARDWFVLLQMR